MSLFMIWAEADELPREAGPATYRARLAGALLMVFKILLPEFYAFGIAL